MHISIVLSLLFLIMRIEAHSRMSEPESTAPMTCRLGGEPKFGIETCAGPCDLRAIQGHFANYRSPDNPAATYHRGQKVKIKYQRNNHGPGGFIRMTLVKPEDMMNKATHAKNAFYYSCWGARSEVASEQEKRKDHFGFNVAGNDGEQHNFPISYYTTTITIPKCVPNGKYVLGWVWYGGTGAPVKGNFPQEPSRYGYFGDYWACSYVNIDGYDQPEASCDVVFENDMSQFSQEGCMSANDRPGVCSFEPCLVEARYQKPAGFKDGKVPPPLTPATFGGILSRSDVVTTAPVQTTTTKDTSDVTSNNSGNTSGMEFNGDVRASRAACRCIRKGKACWRKLAERSGNACKAGSSHNAQSSGCLDSCCSLCQSKRSMNRYLCDSGVIPRLCRLR